MFYFFFELHYLITYSVIFLHFHFEKTQGYGGFFAYAGGGEFVEVAALVVAFDKVFRLDQSFIEQGLEAVV